MGLCLACNDCPSALYLAPQQQEPVKVPEDILGVKVSVEST